MKNSGPWLVGMRPMLLLFTADASEKETGAPPIHFFNRLEAAVRCGRFALPADSADTGRDLQSVGIMSGSIARFLSPNATDEGRRVPDNPEGSGDLPAFPLAVWLALRFLVWIVVLEPKRLLFLSADAFECDTIELAAVACLPLT